MLAKRKTDSFSTLVEKENLNIISTDMEVSIFNDSSVKRARDGDVTDQGISWFRR